MTLETLGTIASRMLVQRGARATYWEARDHLALATRLLAPARRAFAYRVAADQVRFLLGGVKPIADQTRERADAAADWLLRAHDATADGGVSYGYFPCTTTDAAGWLASYPETTGYIISTLVDYATRRERADVLEAARRMADWEIDVQMPTGAVQSGRICRPAHQVAAAFNTGMVLHGFTAIHRATKDARYLEAGRRAADFLLADQGTDGNFRSHGAHVKPHRVKTYTCLCAWALYRFAEDSGETRYRDAAFRAVRAALARQQANGWFADNCLTDPSAPLVHTIAYTLQGILEVGILAGRADLVAAVQRGLDPMLAHVSPRGFLPGRFTARWKPAVLSSCLSGSAQVAIVGYRLTEALGERRYAAVSDRLVNYLKALQALDAADPGVRGALPGSFPILGSYMRAGYPNWATKYYLDALLLQERRAGIA